MSWISYQLQIFLKPCVDRKKQKLPETYFELLDKNKKAFIDATTEEAVEMQAQKRQG